MRKLTSDERRAIVIAALEHNASVTELARCYGVRRQRVHQLLKEAVSDPRGNLREAEKEAAYRRRVLELVG